MNALAGTPAHDPWLAFNVRIAEITEEAPAISTYLLQFTDPQLAQAYTFQPGQFNMLYMPGVGESAISLSGLGRRKGEIAHTIRVAGNVTQTLARLGRGGMLGLRGPFGTPWPLDRCLGWDVVIVSGGLGLAPLRPAVNAVLSEPDRYGRLTVLSGARAPEHLLYQAAYSAETTFLITIGACATAGGIQALRNWADCEEFVRAVYPSPQYIETLATSTPISDHVSVDFELRGCPINNRQLIEVIHSLLQGCRPRTPVHAVCMECKRKGNVCIAVAQGVPCMGPITQAGCGALCPSYDRDQLSPTARRLADELNLPSPCHNPFQAIIARALEVVHAYEEALEILRDYRPVRPPCASYQHRAGEGCAATEAPRGLLYHRYRIDDQGKIAEAHIVPPTSQNQRQIENDLHYFLPAVLSDNHDQVAHACERLIRSYDPCISCSTHFLKLHVEGG